MSRVLSVVLWGRSAARVQRVVVAADTADCVEGLWKKVLKMDRPYGPEGS